MMILNETDQIKEGVSFFRELYPKSWELRPRSDGLDLNRISDFLR